GRSAVASARPPAPFPAPPYPRRPPLVRRPPAGGHPADSVLLRPAAPERDGLDRRARPRQAGQAGGGDAGAPVGPAPGHRGRRRRHPVLPPPRPPPPPPRRRQT